MLTEADAEQVEIQWATSQNRLEYYFEEKGKKAAAKKRLIEKLGGEPTKREIQTEYLRVENPIRRERTRQMYLQINSDI